jgi:ABC-type multidrug transport system permease subunit
MSICLLCYAFPFHVSAITLARSELYPLSDLSCSYVSFLFFTPLSSSFAAFFVFYFSLSIFDVSLPYAIGFSRQWVFVCV